MAEVEKVDYIRCEMTHTSAGGRAIKMLRHFENRRGEDEDGNV